MSASIGRRRSFRNGWCRVLLAALVTSGAGIYGEHTAKGVEPGASTFRAGAVAADIKPRLPISMNGQMGDQIARSAEA
ncbi:hypothetical protein ACYOEI_27015, partial [Singulisphaera rosea]